METIILLIFCIILSAFAFFIGMMAIGRVNSYMGRFDNYIKLKKDSGWVTPGEIKRSVFIPEDVEGL